MYTSRLKISASTTFETWSFSFRTTMESRIMEAKNPGVRTTSNRSVSLVNCSAMVASAPLGGTNYRGRTLDDVFDVDQARLLQSESSELDWRAIRNAYEKDSVQSGS